MEVKKEEGILLFLLAIYVVLGTPVPEHLAVFIDSLLGKIVLFLVIISLFLYSNPIIAILSLFIVVEMVRRSSPWGISALKKYLPTEDHKFSQFTAFNQFPYTLEQEVVKKMAPIMKTGASLTAASYKPMLEKLYDAAPLSSS